LQPGDLAVGELLKVWELELQALKRRAGLRVVRDEHNPASAI
jgi:hypothetical protein